METRRLKFVTKTRMSKVILKKHFSSKSGLCKPADMNLAIVMGNNYFTAFVKAKLA